MIFLTLKYYHGHWNWSEWVNTSRRYRSAVFERYHFDSRKETSTVKISILGILGSWMVSWPANQTNTDHYMTHVIYHVGKFGICYNSFTSSKHCSIRQWNDLLARMTLITVINQSIKL